MVIATAPDGLSKLFDTPEQALAWANDPDAVDAWRCELRSLTTRITERRRQLAGEPMYTEPAPGWRVVYVAERDRWEASNGRARLYFADHADAIAFSYKARR